MSAYVLDKDSIDLLTQAADAMLRLNARYSASYPLQPATVDLLGKYAGDLHSLYRCLYIANIKAVNGRYGEDAKTLPKYTALRQWDIDRLQPDSLKTAAEEFSSWMYQCCEEPVIYTPVWYAISDIYKLLCMYIIARF